MVVAVGYCNDIPDAARERILRTRRWRAAPRLGEVWFLDAVSPRAEGSNPRVDWFGRRDVVRLAESFREFIESQ